MSEYDNKGKVSLWKRNSDNPKAPSYSGDVVAHRDIRAGEVLDLALWPNQSENPKAPQVTGKLGDKQVREGVAPAKPKSQQGVEPFEDDIPFAPRHWLS